MKKRKAKPLKARRSKLKHLNAFLKEYQPIINTLGFLINTLVFLVQILLASLPSYHHDNSQAIENRVEMEEREECVMESIYFFEISGRVGAGSCACPDAEELNRKGQPQAVAPARNRASKTGRTHGCSPTKHDRRHRPTNR